MTGEKCQFGRQQVHYLRHLISNQDVAMDISNVKAIVSWPKLKSVMDLCGFLRLTSY